MLSLTSIILARKLSHPQSSTTASRRTCLNLWISGYSSGRRFIYVPHLAAPVGRCRRWTLGWSIRRSDMITSLQFFVDFIPWSLLSRYVQAGRPWVCFTIVPTNFIDFDTRLRLSLATPPPVRSLIVRGMQQSMTEPFPCLLLVSGTVCTITAEL